MTEQDLAVVQQMQQIFAKTAKLAARHAHLCSLVSTQLTPATEHDVLLVLAEADRCVKEILAQMEVMEGRCERQLCSSVN